MGMMNLLVFSLKVTMMNPDIKYEYLLDGISFIFVLGGTFLALLLSFPFPFFMQSFSMIKIILKKYKVSLDNTIDTLEKLAEQSRKGGTLSLESEFDSLEEEFLKKGIMLLVDGHSKEKISSILKNDIEQMNKRHEQMMIYYERAATYAMTFGLLGTLIQVILTLVQLSVVGEQINTVIGQMATALLPLVYGGIVSYLWYIPIVDKLRIKHEKELLYKNLVCDGVIAIRLGDSPKQVREQLLSYVSEKKRVHHK